MDTKDGNLQQWLADCEALVDWMEIWGIVALHDDDDSPDPVPCSCFLLLASYPVNPIWGKACV